MKINNHSKNMQKMGIQMKHLSPNEIRAEIKRLQKQFQRREEMEVLQTEKQQQIRLKKQQQQETDEVYDLSDLFENQTRYTEEHFTNVVNEVTSLLDRGLVLVVEISGIIVKPDDSTVDEYNILFYKKSSI